MVSSHNAVPSSAPVGLSVTDITPTSLTVHWGNVTCLDRNLDVVFYRLNIFFVFMGISHLSSFSYLPRASATSSNVFIATRLFPRATYAVSVAAYDIVSGGPGPFASVQVTTEISPGIRS